MNALKSDNLDLRFEDGIAFMTITGPIQKDEMSEGLDWFKDVSEANDNFQMCVDMAKADFPSLSAVSEQFRRVADVMRVAQTADKCAVLTDSGFVRNTAKVESAVLPGMDVEAFELEEIAPAMTWLNGEDAKTVQMSDIQIVGDSGPDPKIDAADIDPAHARSSETGGPVAISEATPLKPNVADGNSTAATSKAASAWDNLDISKVDL